MRKRNRISKDCENCGSTFERPVSQMARARFCSKACHDDAQRGERREAECKTCSSVFLARKDHGKWPSFCSRECFESQENGRIDMACGHCGVTFRSKFMKDKGAYRKHCSKECYTASGRAVKTCEMCKEPFVIQKSHYHYRFCSKECRVHACTGELNSGYKGGRYLASSGMIMVFDKDRDRWIGEHRLVAEKFIGRELQYFSEPILHINGKLDDNRECNLFICDDMSHMGYILNTYDVPYPVTSNLSDKRFFWPRGQNTGMYGHTVSGGGPRKIKDLQRENGAPGRIRTSDHLVRSLIHNAHKSST
jgi:hypothetical protein